MVVYVYTGVCCSMFIYVYTGVCRSMYIYVYTGVCCSMYMCLRAVLSRYSLTIFCVYTSTEASKTEDQKVGLGIGFYISISISIYRAPISIYRYR